ncbi:hypothetical protein JTB14_016614 [Gonioctena quinquepunctata]|nr:hypothetical protein JTB14_016614 [Gonioctena quinquepunctata]
MLRADSPAEIVTLEENRSCGEIYRMNAEETENTDVNEPGSNIQGECRRYPQRIHRAPEKLSNFVMCAAISVEPSGDPCRINEAFPEATQINANVQWKTSIFL